jgi:tRNA-dihydrouridine synthase
VQGVLSTLIRSRLPKVHVLVSSHVLVSCCSEMLAAGLLNEGNAKTRAMARFGPGESPRSVQLYGVEVGEVRCPIAS